MTISFENLPDAVSQLHDKLNNIEKLLLSRSSSVPQDSLLTIQEASELIKLSVHSIYGLVSKSKIPVSKKGKRLYFSKQELISWINTGRKKTTSEIQVEANGYLKSKFKKV